MGIVKRNHWSLFLSAGLLTSVMIVPGRADEADVSITEALRITTDVAKRYQFELLSNPTTKLKLHPQPILRWSNPVAGEVHGNVFVWTHQRRPEVIASIFQWFSPLTHGSHEFQSLAIEGIQGARAGESVWTSPPPAGIELQPIADQPPLAESPSVRLRHVRAMARRFQVRKTDRDEVSRELRLLAQPIYRYGGDNSDVLDGALFVFVQGTDPEVFLMIEAREVGETLKWHYALARMNSVKFVAKYQDQEVWRTEILPWGKVKNAQGTYTSFGPFEREAL